MIRKSLALVSVFASVLAVSAASAAAGAPIASKEPGWPQWRGPRRDAVSDETGLLNTWPEGGPTLRWKSGGLGKGWCSPIVVGDTIYITGDVGEELRIFALRPDGSVKWQVANGASWKRPFPGGRGACAYSEGRIYNMNGHGRVVCLEAGTGKEVWADDVLKRFGAKVPYFGVSECLLVDGPNVIVTPAGTGALIAALDKKTGKTAWTGQAPPVAGETAGYSSPILVELGGRRQIIAVTSHRTFAADAKTGKVLWTVGLKFTQSACSTIPVLCGDAVFVTNTSRDDQSTSLLRIADSGDKADKVWTIPVANSSGSAVFAAGNLYVAGMRKLTGYLCLDPKTGKPKATLPALVNASAVWADGKLFALSDNGKAMLLTTGGKGLEKVSEFVLVKDVKKKDAWAHPVLCNGRLYFRYHDTLFCYDVK